MSNNNTASNQTVASITAGTIATGSISAAALSPSARIAYPYPRPPQHTAILSKVLSELLGQALAGKDARIPFASLPQLVRELAKAGVKVEFCFREEEHGYGKTRCMVLSNVMIEVE